MPLRLATRQVLRRLALLVLGAAALLVVPAAQAAYPGANGKVAYKNFGSIWTVNPDGTGAAQLSFPPDIYTEDQSPAWSPAGDKIAFSRSYWNGSTDDEYENVYVMNADGSGLTNLTNGGVFSFNHHPTWSPDGSKIAFVRGGCCAADIYTMNADGSDVTFVRTGHYPAWSPNGSKIAFMGAGVGGSGDVYGDIYVINPDGSGPVNLTNDSRHDVWPAWSPDGTKIVFRRLDSCTPSCGGIWVMNADGSDQRKIHEGGDEPAWSPDGRRMVFNQTDVWVMNADGTDAAELTSASYPYYINPDWQPLPTRSYAHPQSASPLQVSLVRAFRQCGIQSNPVDGQHSPPLGTQACLPPVTGSNLVRVGPDSQGSASFTAVPGDTDATNGDQADLLLSASLSDLETSAGADYLPNPSGADMTEITRLRITDKGNNYGGASGTTTESDFRVPLDCAPTADPALGSDCSANTSADALQPGFITEQRQTVIQAFRVRVDDAGANGVPGNFDDRIFATQGVYIP